MIKIKRDNMLFLLMLIFSIGMLNTPCVKNSKMYVNKKRIVEYF